MFNVVKEYLEKGVEKWDVDIERFLRQKLENVCVVSIIYYEFNLQYLFYEEVCIK